MNKLTRELDKTTELYDVTNWTFQRDLPRRCGEFYPIPAQQLKDELAYLLGDNRSLHTIVFNEHN